MRTLLILAVGLLLSVGCGQSDTKRLEQENERLKEEFERLKEELENWGIMAAEEEAARNQKLKDDLVRLFVVGEYGFEDEDGDIFKAVYLDNGILELHLDGKKTKEYKWKIVKEEIYINKGGYIGVLRINKDKSITLISYIEDKKRTDYSKEEQSTWKKIK